MINRDPLIKSVNVGNFKFNELNIHILNVGLHMINIQLLKREALIFRHAINVCDKDLSTIITSDFPLDNCLLASILLAFHYREQFGIVDIVLFYGRAECESREFRHVWLEIEGYVIDVTGDQYNFIDDELLSMDVIECRPYPCVHIEKISKSYLYQLFSCSQRFIVSNDFSNIQKKFVIKLEYSYNLIQKDLEISRSNVNISHLSKIFM